MERKATSSFVWTLAGSRATRLTRASRILLGWVEKPEKVTPELLRIEAEPNILHAQNACRIDQRGEKAVLDVSCCFLFHENSVCSPEVPDGRGITGQECPALR